MYKVRAEIIGQFVISDKFDNKEKALAEYNSLCEIGIWDNIEMWEVEA